MCVGKIISVALTIASVHTMQDVMHQALLMALAAVGEETFPLLNGMCDMDQP